METSTFNPDQVEVVTTVSSNQTPLLLDSYNIQINTFRIIIVLISFLFSCMGTIFMIFVLFRNKKLLNFTNILVANLSCSSLLLVTAGLLSTLRDIIYRGQWPFGQFLCQAMSSVFLLIVFVVAYSIVGICYARFRIICKSGWSALKAKMAIYYIIIIWLLGIIYVIPYGNLITVNHYRNISSQCQYDAKRFPLISRQVFILITILIVFMIPLILIIAWQFLIGNAIQKVHALPPPTISNTLSAQSTNLAISHRDSVEKVEGNEIDRAKKQLVLMSAAIVVVFFLTWFPYYLFQALIYFRVVTVPANVPKAEQQRIFHHFMIIRNILLALMHLFAFFNTLVCCTFNPCFKHAIGQLFQKERNVLKTRHYESSFSRFSTIMNKKNAYVDKSRNP